MPDRISNHSNDFFLQTTETESRYVLNFSVIPYIEVHHIFLSTLVKSIICPFPNINYFENELGEKITPAILCVTIFYVTYLAGT